MIEILPFLGTKSSKSSVSFTLMADLFALVTLQSELGVKRLCILILDLWRTEFQFYFL